MMQAGEKLVYLVIAYTAVYAAIALYVLYLGRREHALRRELEALRRASVPGREQRLQASRSPHAQDQA